MGITGLEPPTANPPNKYLEDCRPPIPAGRLAIRATFAYRGSPLGTCQPERPALNFMCRLLDRLPDRRRRPRADAQEHGTAGPRGAAARAAPERRPGGAGEGVVSGTAATTPGCRM